MRGVSKDLREAIYSTATYAELPLSHSAGSEESRLQEVGEPWLLTRDFKTTIRDRVQRDPKFRKELFREALEALLSGEIDLAKTILRDFINATVSCTDQERHEQWPR